jgi:endonuclease VIII
MPEGHTIHRLARELRRDLRGEALRVTSPQGRFVLGAELLDRATLTRSWAHGKHLFLDLQPVEAPPEELHVHLGLFGKFRRQASPPADPVGEVRLRFEGPSWTWDLSGPTACELIDRSGRDQILRRLGPDPLRRNADPAQFLTRVARSERPIGALLLDQAVIAGVGNVYRSELCFRHGVDPRRAGRDLDPVVVRAMWDDIVSLLAIGVRLGRIVTVDPADPCLARPRSSPAQLPQADRLYVYRRDHCRRCDAPVEWFELANRRAYACPVEQR